MRQLTFLFCAFILALIAQNLINSAEFYAAYILRDSLLLSAFAAILFGLNASSLSLPQIPYRFGSWHLSHIIFIATGAICAIVGSLLFSVLDAGTSLQTLRLTLWLLGLLLIVFGAIWKARSDRSSRPHFRWQKNEAGEFVRVLRPASKDGTLSTTKEDDEQDADGARTDDELPPAAFEPFEHIGGGVIFLFVLIITLIGAALRFNSLNALPPDCIGTECIVALRLAELEPWQAFSLDSHPLLERIALILQPWLEQEVERLRLSSAAIGILTIPIFFLFARQATRAGGALAATALFALNPWHIWASVSAESRISLPLMISLVAWIVFRAWRTANALWWVVGGLGLALFLWSNELNILFGLWSLLFVLLSPFALRHQANLNQQNSILIQLPFFMLLSALLGLGPWMAQNSLAGVFSHFNNLTDQIWLSADELWQTINLIGRTLLWSGELSGVRALTDVRLLSWLGAASFLLGIGVLWRHILAPVALLIITGFVLLGMTIPATFTTDSTLAGPMLILLPLIFVTIALALDQLLAAFVHVWSRLVSPTRALVVACAIVLAFGIPSAFSLSGKLETIGAGEKTSTDNAMARYLAEQLQEEGDATFLVPATVLSNPTARLSAGNALDEALAAELVRSLNASQDLIFPPESAGDLIFLTSIQNRSLLDLLTALFPYGQAEPQVNERTEEIEFVAYRLSAQSLTADQGLRGYFFEGESNDLNTILSHETATLVNVTPMLQFEWGNQSPLPPPFHARWEGTLLTPLSGHYAFTLDDGFDRIRDGEVQLRLDNVLILDTIVGLTEQRIPLAQGAYRLDLRYQSGSEPDGFGIRWQTPGDQFEPIPTSFLRSTPLPAIGLEGSYFAGSNLTGPELTLQKDLVVGLVADLPRPYSVRWRGNFAAARAGEYMLAALTQGDIILHIDRQTVFDSQRREEDDANADINASIGYSEGVIYLQRGWHPVEIDYVPADSSLAVGETELQLFWQPPGGTPEQLPVSALAPIPAPLSLAEWPLPPAPELAESWLGDADFALTQASLMRQPQAILPPARLPSFDAEQLWQIDNGCGSEENQLNAPRGLVIDDLNRLVYLADTGNQRIVEYSFDGTTNRLIHSQHFQEPFDLDILHGENGRTPLILDAVAQQVFRIDPSADPLADPVTPLPQDASFYRPRGFGVDTVGNILVADTGGARMVILNPRGQQLAEFGGRETLFGRGQPVDVVSAAGRFWAITAEDGRLWRLEGDPATSGSVTAVAPSNTFDAAHFADLPDGSFFMTDPMRSTLLYYGADGQPLRQFAFPGIFVTPVGIDAAIIDARIYFAVSDSAACTVSLWRVLSMG